MPVELPVLLVPLVLSFPVGAGVAVLEGAVVSVLLPDAALLPVVAELPLTELPAGAVPVVVSDVGALDPALGDIAAGDVVLEGVAFAPELLAALDDGVGAAALVAALLCGLTAILSDELAAVAAVPLFSATSFVYWKCEYPA